MTSTFNHISESLAGELEFYILSTQTAVVFIKLLSCDCVYVYTLQTDRRHHDDTMSHASFNTVLGQISNINLCTRLLY